MRFLLFLLCAVGTIAPQAEGMLLRVRPEVGTTLRYVQVQDQQTEMTMGALGQQNTSSKTTMEYRLTVKEPTGDGNIAFEITYDRVAMEVETGPQQMSYDSANEDTGEGNPLGVLRKVMVGRTLDIVASPLGEILEVKGLAGAWDELSVGASDDPMTAQLMATLKDSLGDDAMKVLMQQTGVMFPEERVAPGAEWSKEVRLESTPFGAMRIEIDYQLAGSEGNRAEIDFAGEITIEGESALIEQMREMFRQQDIAVDISYDLKTAASAGRIGVDQATGTIDKMTMNVELVFDMALKMTGEAMNMTIASHQKTTLTRVE